MKKDRRNMLIGYLILLLPLLLLPLGITKRADQSLVNNALLK